MAGHDILIKNINNINIDDVNLLQGEERQRALHQWQKNLRNIRNKEKKEMLKLISKINSFKYRRKLRMIKENGKQYRRKPKYFL